MKCEYCGTDDQTGKVCNHCGAKLPEKQGDVTMRAEPFFYNGYIVYMLRDYSTDTVECQFWLGMELIERFSMSREFLRETVLEGTDSMPFFWDLFLVARGEVEVLQWKEKNTIRPALFEVRRLENPENERLRALTIRDLAMEFRR